MGIFSRLFSKKNQSNQQEVKERTVLNMEVGDIVSYDLVDYEVVGKIVYRDHGYEWTAYQLLEGKNTIWLSAEMDDELELGVYKTVQLPVSETFPKTLNYEGKTYHLEEEGNAQVHGQGRSKQLSGRTIHYGDYVDEEEETFLSVETWGTEVEVSLGHPIEEYEIKIIAGSI
ncbi:DUF4178 domain-containing protein [Salinibacillus xinjiangensis]|uniref:DUF4178 domain-containing protein n=1 Tax=Salinibacillus xinjiangensis TaxID=1229268 RepID=A0A6G1X9T3_9BACI|nr:DUF4178 domain-containing protein [Salinibacillus xinjiangensis]MRG87702.1 DUF4178 domain-containing protein [Salinibacillus xinjiangensis]